MLFRNKSKSIRTSVPHSRGHPDSTPSSSFPQSQLPENPATQGHDVKEWKTITYTQPQTQTHVQPHHRVQSQGMETSRGSCRVVSVPQVLELLLGFMQHLYTL